MLGEKQTHPNHICKLLLNWFIASIEINSQNLHAIHREEENWSPLCISTRKLLFFTNESITLVLPNAFGMKANVLQVEFRNIPAHHRDDEEPLLSYTRTSRPHKAFWNCIGILLVRSWITVPDPISRLRRRWNSFNPTNKVPETGGAGRRNFPVSVDKEACGLLSNSS